MPRTPTVSDRRGITLARPHTHRGLSAAWSDGPGVGSELGEEWPLRVYGELTDGSGSLNGLCEYVEKQPPPTPNLPHLFFFLLIFTHSIAYMTVLLSVVGASAKLHWLPGADEHIGLVMLYPVLFYMYAEAKHNYAVWNDKPINSHKKHPFKEMWLSSKDSCLEEGVHVFLIVSGAKGICPSEVTSVG